MTRKEFQEILRADKAARDLREPEMIAALIQALDSLFQE